MSSSFVLVDGQPVDVLPVDDPAVTQGLAVFEVARTYQGRPFRLPTHLERLRASAAFCGIDWPEACLTAEVASLLDQVEGEQSIHIMLTGGGRRIVRVVPLDLGRVGSPLRLASCAFTPPPWMPGWVKHTARAPWLMAVRSAGVDEVLFHDETGLWTEANRSNIVAVRNGLAITPPDDGRILRGVTRGALLDAARREQLPLVESPLPAGPVDELYVVSTLKEFAPVSVLDGVQLGGWGPVGTALAAALRRIIEAESGREP
jgi:branched-subunit amino acid aminotransferase/4-amino-4-deoxychorismate lyase